MFSQKDALRGPNLQQQGLFYYASLEQRIPADDPLRAIRVMVDEVLEQWDEHFDDIYDEEGRLLIAPERLLRAPRLMLLSSIRSERQPTEPPEYNLPDRWFVGLGMNEPVWHTTTFTKTRDRPPPGHVARAFFAAVVRQARRWGLKPIEHFSMDGTRVEA